jgi:exodeoxyribonuclease V gamma subunit
LVPAVPFSFDRTVLRAARAATGERAAPPRFIRGPLPAPPPDDVILADLVGFFKDPVKGFFRALEFTLPRDVDGVQDAMPVDINALEEWTVGDRMLRDKLGWRRANEIREQATLLAGAAQRYRRAQAGAYDIDIDLGCGRRLTGTVSPVYGERLVSVTYSKLDGKHLLESWIPLLALIAHDRNRDWSAVCIGRAKRGTEPRVAGLGRPQGPDHQAVGVLRELVPIYDAGRREPIPLPIKTSYAWAAARHAGDDPLREAQYRWKWEDEQPAYVRAWGKNARLEDLMQPLRPGEECDGEDNRLGAYSARLWLPMLRAEQRPS